MEQDKELKKIMEDQAKSLIARLAEFFKAKKAKEKEGDKKNGS